MSADETFEPVRCFISYSRADNQTYAGVADEVKARIKGMYQAKTGRSLEIFLDRDDIGWGADWREQISLAVNGAGVFIPLITMHYFNRPRCREELMAYYDSATLLGVTDLILPIILAGHSMITEDSSRPEVRIIERLNHRSVESAITKGFTSSEWLTAMDEITEELIRAIDRAEQRLGDAEGAAGSTVTLSPTVREQGPSATGPAWLAEAENTRDLYILSLRARFAEETAALRDGGTITKATVALTELVTILTDGFPGTTDLATLQRLAPSVALRAGSAARRLDEAATGIAGHVRSADAAVRQLVSSIADPDFPDLQQQMTKAIDEISKALSPALAPDTDPLLASIRVHQALSVSLRQALSPAYRGLAALRDAVDIITSWRQISV